MNWHETVFLSFQVQNFPLSLRDRSVIHRSSRPTTSLQSRHPSSYGTFRTDIDDFLTVLPLLQELSKDSIQPRHWTEVMEVISFLNIIGRWAFCSLRGSQKLSFKAVLERKVIQIFELRSQYHIVPKSQYRSRRPFRENSSLEQHFSIGIAPSNRIYFVFFTWLRAFFAR